MIEDHVPADDMPAMYANADAFVLPTYGEGWGLPTMEAMSMALPVISTDWGGSTEVCGVLTPLFSSPPTATTTHPFLLLLSS